MKEKSIKIREEGSDYDYQFLTVDENYTVYGILHNLNKHLSYLISTGKDSIPFYAPSDLFTIVDGTIPSPFKVATISFPGGSSRCIISYEELSSYNHHNGLIVQDSEQLKVFFDKKKQIDEELMSSN